MATATKTPGPTPTIRGLPRPLARALEAYADRLDVDKIREAYDLAADAHAGQQRASGEDYVTHTVEVATILALLRLDTASIVAGLIHDTVEDTAISLADLETRFGEEVATIVDGVTKLGRVQFRSATEQQVENYRKMLLSMADDARVILVKLADRLHNMRTLEHLPASKQRRIALETREIYAPLAHRLGMAAIRWELEDLAFKFLEPEAYEDLRKKVKQRRKERERQILEMQRPLEEALAEAGIPAEVSGRPKHLWSIHRKMVHRNRPYEEIYDLMAMRVTTDSVQNCYAALGVIHSRWTPIPERFHDYIATPKSNMYRSLHTTVFGPGGRRYEIQIRTEEMHRTAEYGIAAHWRYKEGGGAGWWWRPRGERGRRGADLVPPGAGVAAGHAGAGGVHGVPPHGPLPGRDLRVHAEGGGEGHPAGLHAHRLRLQRAHRGRAALRRREGERAHRAAVARAPERGHRRDHHQRAPAPQPGLARVREDVAGAAAHPPVDPQGGVRLGAQAGPGVPRPGAEEGQDGPSRGPARPAGGRPGARLPRLRARARGAGPRRRGPDGGHQAALPGPRSGRGGPAPAHRAGEARRAAAHLGAGRAHPGDGQPHGALLPLLPARARRRGGRLHHAGQGGVHPPPGLPQRAGAVARPGAAGGDRVGRREGRPLLRAALHAGHGPAGAPLRRGQGDQRHRHRHPARRHAKRRRAA